MLAINQTQKVHATYRDEEKEKKNFVGGIDGNVDLWQKDPFYLFFLFFSILRFSIDGGSLIHLYLFLFIAKRCNSMGV